jgi:pimeloyl-ACP methyl ester carboxylesterase
MTARPDLPLDHVTPYDRFAFSDVEMEHLLVTGAHRRELVGYFGADEYRDLARLARQAARTPNNEPELHVIVVPGIMGSQLGLTRTPPLPNDVLWVDPIDISIGRLASLRLPRAAPIVSLGVVLYSYLRLKLQLRAAGLSVSFHDYDWRLGVDELGRAFAERLRKESAPRLAIVAHSMGGLVSRAAVVLPGAERVERVLLLGSPNFGSFATIQALRGTYAVVRKIARLTNDASAEALAGQVFNTFPSLYHMLPSGRCSNGTDLFDSNAWPQSGPRPDEQLLEHARAVQSTLAQADSRFACIVGIGQETVTGVQRRGDDFVYTITRHGDGTVPVISAALPGVPTHYAQVAHSDLTRDRLIAAAVVDLLRKGVTRKLPTRWASSSVAEARITDTQLRRTDAGKVDWTALEPEERRVFLQNLNEPPKLNLRVPARARGAKRASAKARLRRPKRHSSH